MKIRWFAPLLALSVMVLLAACGGGAAAPTATAESLPPAPTPETPLPETTNLPPIGGDKDVILGGLIVQLVGALNNRDIPTLQLMTLDNTVTELAWGDQPAADMTVEQMVAAYLPSSEPVTMIDVGQYNYATDTWEGPTYELILGYNIRECCGSTVLVAAAVHVSGFGPDGLNEAILVIIDGAPVNMNFVWHAFTVFPIGDGGDQEIGGPFALSLGDYEEAVRQAVIARDFEAIAQLMQVDHTIGYWQSEGVTASPIESASTLVNNTDPMVPITFAEVPPDIYSFFDPDTFFGPNVNVADVLYSSGWGASGAGEALFVIQQMPDGSYAWTHTLLAANGF